MANILGGSGNDVLNGTANDDTINGGSGNDQIDGGAGHDNLIGGKGMDYIDAGIGNDKIDAGSENDTVYGGTGSDIILGGSGNDLVFADTFQSTSRNFIENGSFENIFGSATATAYGYSDTVLPGWTLESGPAFELVNPLWNGISPSDGFYWLDMDASPGNIKISQTVGDLEVGQSYKLTFTAADFNAGGGAPNTVVVSWGGVSVGILGGLTNTMQSYSIEVFGGAGDGSNKLSFQSVGAADNIGVSLDNVRLYSNADVDGLHNDSIDGGSGNDALYGFAGNDTINGGSENDFIDGGSGNDSLLGGSSGADTLVGGLGADIMNGGSGADVFQYDYLSESTSAAHDVIKGWDASDVIRLVDPFDNSLGYNNIAFGAATGSTLGYTYVAGNTVIVADNTFGTDFTITIEGIQTLTNADFIYA